jgi:probable DNA repair protein
VELDDCEASARNEDSRLFARAARRYRSLLTSEGWVDAAGMPALLARYVSDGKLRAPAGLALAGFDRIAPQLQRLLDTFAAAGTSVAAVPVRAAARDLSRHSFNDTTSELRSAGAWARDQLVKNPALRVGIVIPGLEQDAAKYARLVSEGFLPGWQYAGRKFDAALNVSFGRRLGDYPAIAIALRALRWLHSDLTTTEVSHLLRSPLLGIESTDARTRIEVRLRQMPSQTWSPQRLVRVLRRPGAQTGDEDSLRRLLNRLQEFRMAWPQRDIPSAWAERFDTALAALGWPGGEELESGEFQLVNRWRDLLNELAHLGLVTRSMSLAEAHARLAGMAADTVFQPEADTAALNLLGPLEAAGMEFDRLWIAGLSATNWPPTGRPMRLVSGELQRHHGLPDAAPEDTLLYARRVLERLVRSADQVRISYAVADGDAVQTASSLLYEYAPLETPAPPDPGWHARSLIGRVSLVAAADAVPAVDDHEVVAGGAATIQRQLEDPFAAFVHGRLGVRLLPVIAAGLRASLRGSIIHDALHRLYAGLPARGDIRGWDDQERAERIAAAVQSALGRRRRHSDAVVASLLALEERRVRELLRDVISVDCERPEFVVAHVEHDVPAEISGIRLRLRVDRIDQDADGGKVVIDYKTGMPKALLERDGSLRDVQLAVYTCAIAEPVSAIALFNIDSRGVGIDGAGAGWRPDLDWAESLDHWQAIVERAAGDIRNGDVRLRRIETIDATRPLGLLSRYRELIRDA